MMPQTPTETKKPRRLGVVIPPEFESDLDWYQENLPGLSESSAIIAMARLGIWTAKTTKRLTPPAKPPQDTAPAATEGGQP